MKKITQEMIDTVIREIEEPLITERELSEHLGHNRDTIHRMAAKLKIIPLVIYENGHYNNAYNTEQAKQIIERCPARTKRKNKLRIGDLT